MLLFENSIIRLDYNPATDILEVEYPDLQGYLLPEIKHNINIMIDIIKSYDIKYLLLDSTRTIISVSEEESREVATFLAGNLMNTRVQKVARIQSPSDKVERTAQSNVKHIKESGALSFELEFFTNKKEALAWLHPNT